MSHVANQRIKKGGKYFAAGDPITLTDEELKDLPEGVVSAQDGDSEAETVAPVVLTEDQQAQLQPVVAKLKPGAFKQDGEIRAGALKHLNDTLGFAVTAADVTAAQETGGE